MGNESSSQPSYLDTRYSKRQRGSSERDSKSKRMWVLLVVWVHYRWWWWRWGRRAMQTGKTKRVEIEIQFFLVFVRLKKTVQFWMNVKNNHRIQRADVRVGPVHHHRLFSSSVRESFSSLNFFFTLFKSQVDNGNFLCCHFWAGLGGLFFPDECGGPHFIMRTLYKWWWCLRKDCICEWESEEGMRILRLKNCRI